MAINEHRAKTSSSEKRRKTSFSATLEPNSKDALVTPEQGTVAIVALAPESTDVLLTRAQAGAALRARGFPICDRTLARKACVGGGPKFRRFGRVPLYRLSDLLLWAQSRLSAPVSNTSEAGIG
jgi:hypothetical protein